MAAEDVGVKIAEPNKGVYSTDPDDYTFWSKYQPLMLIKQENVTLTIPANTQTGTQLHTHGFTFPPLIIPTITTDALGDVPFPHISSYGNAPLTPEAAEYIFTSQYFNMRITATQVQIQWDRLGFDGGGGPSGAYTFAKNFNVRLDYYNIKLGTNTI